MTRQGSPADVAAAAAARQSSSNDVAEPNDTAPEPTTDDRSVSEKEPTGEEEDGYPKGTPTAEMTPEQREAYWKSLARKHEKQSKTLERERSVLQQERDELKKVTETEFDRQIREAREEAARETRTEIQKSTVQAMYRMALRNNGVKDEAIDSIVEEVNFSVFTTTDGEIDDERLVQSAQRHAGTASTRRFPDMGQDRIPPTRMTGLAAGRKAYEETHRKNKN